MSVAIGEVEMFPPHFDCQGGMVCLHARSKAKSPLSVEPTRVPRAGYPLVRAEAMRWATRVRIWWNAHV